MVSQGGAGTATRGIGATAVAGTRRTVNRSAFSIGIAHRATEQARGAGGATRNCRGANGSGFLPSPAMAFRSAVSLRGIAEVDFCAENMAMQESVSNKMR